MSVNPSLLLLIAIVHEPGYSSRYGKKWLAEPLFQTFHHGRCIAVFDHLGPEASIDKPRGERDLLRQRLDRNPVNF